MRRLAPLLLLLTLAACAGQQTGQQAAEPAIGQAEPAVPGSPGGEMEVSQASLAKWASFPVDATPRPLVLLGELVKVELGFSDGDGKLAFGEGRIDADGRVPAEAAEAFAKMARMAEPGAGEPRLKVISAVKGTATFHTDRGPRDLPAWNFQLTQTLGPISVLAVKADYVAGFQLSTAKLSADGKTLTVPMGKADEPCPGEARVTYEPRWLESPTAVAVGLSQVVGSVAPGEKADCFRDLMLRTTDYTIKLDKPLGNRVLVDAAGNPLPVVSS